MSNIFPGLETTFNTVAAQYDRMRPTYVEALYDDIWNYGGFGENVRALEVGIGTGQATQPVLNRGAAVTAVELGGDLAAFCAQKFAVETRFSVVNMDFSDFDAPEGTFDLIYSASAFHWIPEETGYTKVMKLLRPGGVFARFANHPYRDKGNDALHEAMQVHYAKYMPKSKLSPEYSMEDAEKRGAVGKKYGFEDIRCRLYKRTRAFTAEQYTELLGTYSDHIALGEKKEEFFSLIRREIERFGGTFTVYDTIDLELHRKPE
ncbi:MAG: methyltransferase domain-containing protein [Clostridia bacterium]|nr:methyltransferase domain-containing protein [Clostridia bacterium]